MTAENPVQNPSPYEGTIKVVRMWSHYDEVRERKQFEKGEE